MNGRGTWPPPFTREPGAFYNVARSPKRRSTYRSPVTPARRFLNGALALGTLALVAAIPLALLVGCMFMALALFELVR